MNSFLKDLILICITVRNFKLTIWSETDVRIKSGNSNIKKNSNEKKHR